MIPGSHVFSKESWLDWALVFLNLLQIFKSIDETSAGVEDHINELDDLND